MLLNWKTRFSAAANFLVLLLALPQAATATIVEVETDLGTCRNQSVRQCDARNRHELS